MTIPEAPLNEFRMSLRGDILLPGEPGSSYES